MVKVEWLGHACFLVAGERATVVIDPFATGEFGYPPLDMQADLVLVSHEHHDHNYVKAVKGNPKVIRGQGEWKEPVQVKGVMAHHDARGGSLRGRTAMYRFVVDDVTFCHLGDLGDVLDESQIKQLKPVDVLMVPVGGFYTIDHKQADKVIELLEPKLAIPMHYKNEYVDYPIDPVEKFTSGKQNVRFETSNSIEVDKGSLPATTQIVVLGLPPKK